MKVFALVLALASSAIALSNVSFAEEKKAAKTAEEGTPPNMDFFRCVRMRGTSLADLKARLVTECNLLKPFSFTAADVAIDSSFTFCCHKQ